jgi:hypothetical protein
VNYLLRTPRAGDVRSREDRRLGNPALAGRNALVQKLSCASPLSRESPRVLLLFRPKRWGEDHPARIRAKMSDL